MKFLLFKETDQINRLLQIDFGQALAATPLSTVEAR
jgi:hypothetical protein